MNIATIGAIVSVVCALLGLLGKVISMSMQFQSLVSRLDQNEKRDEEERKENALKFNELYNSRNKTNETIVELTTTMKMMMTNMNQQFDSLNKKIDGLKENK